MHCELDLGDTTLGQGHDTPLGHGQQLFVILSVYANYIGPSVMTDANCEGFPTCDDRITENDKCVIKIIGIHCIIQIQLGSEELWPGHRFRVCVHCDLYLGDMTLGQGHDISLGHGQQLCEILSRSNLAVRSYGQDTDFGYVCTVTFTLEI